MSSLLRTVLVLVMAGWVAVVGAGPAAADEGDLVKVFVVTDASQTLPAIAAGTLGDQRRAGEIFELNRGRPQPDGAALATADEPLRPGWILRLPQDASGPDVKQARETAGQPQNHDPNQDQASGTTVSFSLAAALAIVAALLLALITAAILSRRQVAAGVRRIVHAVREPGRRRRRLAARRVLAERFAADGESVRRAYDTAGEAAAAAPGQEGLVHAIQLDQGGASVWLTAADELTTPWQQADSTRWHRTADNSWRGAGLPELSTACLVRAGADAAGEAVFVDLSRLDGVLSVTGDQRVARDVVQNVLGEVARLRPGTPVMVFPSTDGTAPLVVPAGLEVVPLKETPMTRTVTDKHGPLRGVAERGPVGGLIVVAGTPDARQIGALTALCGSRGAGWTGLVCGDAGTSAHWRWHAAADGTVEIPVLGVELTVPALSVPA
ncbi:hypothetical protein [Actinoplanes awajinensis]|uniref:Uncharacterized protein n=1 Tax=Actinoplanes awajinensis subsp. mycoplanecinus TaxID=135947 RepID=A0A0X3V469_9ACTN|nr:hypothetical protein [Actinoplanes awajinensis]KUL39520.1 hypothetical protein ADL15_09685 [Actinoplanes awajinensis subsp. mycoplanecinus]